MSRRQQGKNWLKIDHHWVWYIQKAAKNHCFRLRITKCKKLNLLRPDFNRIDWFWSKIQNSGKNLQLKKSDFCHFENSEKMSILSWVFVQSGFSTRNRPIFCHFNSCTYCDTISFYLGENHTNSPKIQKNMNFQSRCKIYGWCRSQWVNLLKIFSTCWPWSSLIWKANKRPTIIQ